MVLLSDVQTDADVLAEQGDGILRVTEVEFLALLNNIIAGTQQLPGRS